jgi:hypothetical protein
MDKTPIHTKSASQVKESIEESLQRDERRRNVFMVYGVELIEDGTDSRL